MGGLQIPDWVVAITSVRLSLGSAITQASQAQGAWLSATRLKSRQNRISKRVSLLRFMYLFSIGAHRTDWHSLGEGVPARYRKEMLKS
jgi:hypothetical protein